MPKSCDSPSVQMTPKKSRKSRTLPRIALQRARDFRARERALKKENPMLSLPSTKSPSPNTSKKPIMPSKRTHRKSKTRTPYTSSHAHPTAHRNFQSKFLDNPFGHVCGICDRLWFKNDLRIPNPPHQKLLSTVMPDVDLAALRICKCCVQALSCDRLPTLATFNGFQYPARPGHLPHLDPISARLIVPCLPFLQIRRLQNLECDARLVEQVINIPLSSDNLVSQLPRNALNDYCLNVNIEDEKSYPSSNLVGLIDKEPVQQWLDYMIQTPLYESHTISINAGYFSEDFDKIPTEAVETVSSSSYQTAQQQTLLWNVDKYLENSPSEGNTPQTIVFNDYVERLAFPQIYFGQLQKYLDVFKLTPLDVISSELRRRDRRGVTPQHLLYMAMKLMNIRVNDAINATREMGKDWDLMKHQIFSEEYINQSLDSHLCCLNYIPNSRWYWNECRRDLLTMLRQLGRPTLSMTLGANEAGWPGLIRLLYNLQTRTSISDRQFAKMQALEKAILINEDAVTCAIYYNKLLTTIMTILQTKKGNPFDQFYVTHYFQHIEFQADGSPQAQLLLWLAEAPKDPLGADMERAIRLIDAVSSVAPIAAPKMINLQVHQHTDKCYSRQPRRDSRACRFEAPYMPSRATMILTPMPKTDPSYQVNLKAYQNIRQNLEDTDYADINEFYMFNDIHSDEHYIDILRAGINRPRVFLKRKPSEKSYDSFNPFILDVLQASMKIEFIPDDHSCADHIIDYMYKSETGTSDLKRRITNILKDNPDFDIHEVTRHLGGDILNTVEMTSQEAAWYLLGESLFKVSIAIIDIPTARPEERTKSQKSRHELFGQHTHEDWHDFWQECLFEKYQMRSSNLDDLSLAEFAACYSWNYVSSKYMERRRPCLIRYHNYSMIHQPEEFKREMVTLYVPFRNEQEEILDDYRYLELYAIHEADILVRRQQFESDLDVQAILDRFNGLFCDEDTIKIEEVKLESDPLDGFVDETLPDMDWDEVEVEGKVTLADHFDPLESATPVDPDEQAMSSAFTIVRSGKTPFDIFLSGPLACPKTFIIRVMTEVYNRYKLYRGRCNIFTNYTSADYGGTSIEGRTIFTTLRIGINKLVAMTPEVAEQYRELFHYVQMLIIDEVNTIGPDLVKTVNKRLKQITGNVHVNFGGVSIILAGLLNQSQVSPDQPVASLLATLESLKLEKVMEEFDDLFSTILKKMRDGIELEESELQLLESRFFTEEETEMVASQAIRIFNTEHAALEYNQVAMDSAEHKVLSVATDACVGCACTEQAFYMEKFQAMSIEETRGLPYELILVPNKVYKVTTAMDPVLGLVPGALGRLVHIERDANEEIIKLWLNLLHPTRGADKRRKRIRLSLPIPGLPASAIPLARRKWSFYMNDARTVIVTRDHFSLAPACGISIDEAEDKCFQQMVYAYSSNETLNAVQNILSRIRHVSGLYITSTNGDQTFYHLRKNSTAVINPQVESVELMGSKSITFDAMLRDFILSRTTLSVLCFDAQSLSIQSADLNDLIRKKLGILLLLETCADDDNFQVPDFNCAIRFRTSGQRHTSVVIEKVGDNINVGTSHMNVTFRNATSLIANFTDIAAICGAHCRLEDGTTVVVVIVHVCGDAEIPQIMEFLHRILLAYTTHGAALLSRNLGQIPMIFGGHFGVDLKCPAAQQLISFLEVQFSLGMTEDPAVGPSTTGTNIDAIFSRNLQELEASFVLYSSFEESMSAGSKWQPITVC